ncbi:MAG: XRE family transcriptional regulator [Chloroflexi bacterium]|nr:XRE family transcriptional regulator [Chloroflexota bacterium]MBU1746491.1 XRE family transcriptional regulator [Chloroflexota bacterium]
MDFGAWLYQARVARGWDMRALAQTAYMDAGLVSRTERGCTQPTLDTVVRLCQALGVSLVELAPGLDPQLVLEQPEIDNLGPALTLADADRFVRYAVRNPDRARGLWAQLLEAGPYSPAFRALSQTAFPTNLSPALTWPYPPLSADRVVEIYHAGGALVPHDAGAYVRQWRQHEGHSLASLERVTGISDSVLSRLETGRERHIKLATVWALDEAGTPRGLTLGLYWRVAQLTARIDRSRTYHAAWLGWSAAEGQLVLALINLWRWLQHQGAANGWLDQIRFAS